MCMCSTTEAEFVFHEGLPKLPQDVFGSRFGYVLPVLILNWASIARHSPDIKGTASEACLPITVPGSSCQIKLTSFEPQGCHVIQGPDKEHNNPSGKLASFFLEISKLSRLLRRKGGKRRKKGKEEKTNLKTKEQRGKREKKAEKKKNKGEKEKTRLDKKQKKGKQRKKKKKETKRGEKKENNGKKGENTTVCRIRDALDPLACYVWFTAIARCRPLGASLWFVTHTPTSTQEALERSLAPTGSRSRCSSPRTCRRPKHVELLHSLSAVFTSFRGDVSLIHKFELLPVRTSVQHSLDPTAMLSIPQRSLQMTSACPECACL